VKGIRNALGYILPMVRPSEKCEACGKQFHCNASVWGCWCAEIKLSDAARARLKEKYRGCLCRECLEKADVGAAESGEIRNE
jgi:hypothetical protein